MCRRNQLFGGCLIAFGLGILIGLCLESGFICGCIGISGVTAGLFLLQQK